MTSTELDLKRTLTDVLEDELYNINYHGQNSGRNVLGLSLPTEFDETMLNGDFWDRQEQDHQQDHQVDWNQQQDENNIFNKYADPSLTMTSSHLKNHHNEVSTTPVQGTVNLNNVLKVSNPFFNMRNQLPYDVKITNDYHDEADSTYNPQDSEDLVGFDGSNNPKMQWPLQDNNMALSNEDARMIFDHEFPADDDDLSDEDDEGEQDGNQKVFDACDFVDGINVFGAQDNSDQPIINDDDDDDDMLEEDELYEPSIRSGRKESVVSTPHPEVVSESSPLTTISKSPLAFTNSNSLNNNNNNNNSNSRSRRKLPIIDQNTNNTHNNNNSTSTGSHHNNNSSSNGEIYTCLILNNITKQPCSAQFSRSYDLTRHQNTIHAKKKTVFRCSECIGMLGHDGYQKTFSRLDALTRHIKSKHENLSLEQRQEVTKYAKENIGYVV